MNEDGTWYNKFSVEGEEVEFKQLEIYRLFLKNQNEEYLVYYCEDYPRLEPGWIVLQLCSDATTTFHFKPENDSSKDKPGLFESAEAAIEFMKKEFKRWEKLSEEHNALQLGTTTAEIKDPTVPKEEDATEEADPEDKPKVKTVVETAIEKAEPSNAKDVYKTLQGRRRMKPRK